MTKKQFLEMIWLDLLENTTRTELPKKPGDIQKIHWTFYIGYGQTSKLLEKHIRKYQKKMPF